MNFKENGKGLTLSRTVFFPTAVSRHRAMLIAEAE